MAVHSLLTVYQIYFLVIHKACIIVFCFNAEGLRMRISMLHLRCIDPDIPHIPVVIQEEGIPVHHTLYVVCIHGQDVGR